MGVVPEEVRELDVDAGRVALVAVALILVLAHPIEPQILRWPAIILLIVCTALGAPVFTALGGIALILVDPEHGDRADDGQKLP